MKRIAIAVILAASGAANASGFSALQDLGGGAHGWPAGAAYGGQLPPAAQFQVPAPAAPQQGFHAQSLDAVEVCSFTGLDGGLCAFRCPGGKEIYENPYMSGPVGEPRLKICATHIFRTVPAPAAKAAINPAQIPQVPPFNPAWNNNNGMTPFPQPPQTTLDVCEYTGFENGKCMFACRSGDTLAEDKIDNGTPGGVCATHIFRTIPSPFAGFKAAARTKGVRACLFRENTADTCVYGCDDGSEYTRPMARPGPFGDEPVLPCPQLVFPF